VVNDNHNMNWDPPYASSIGRERRPMIEGKMAVCKKLGSP
jgi:hypothetical protein